MTSDYLALSPAQARALPLIHSDIYCRHSMLKELQAATKENQSHLVFGRSMWIDVHYAVWTAAFIQVEPSPFVSWLLQSCGFMGAQWKDRAYLQSLSGRWSVNVELLFSTHDPAEWQIRVCYYWYLQMKQQHPNSAMGGFTRLLHRYLPCICPHRLLLHALFCIRHQIIAVLSYLRLCVDLFWLHAHAVGKATTWCQRFRQ